MKLDVNMGLPVIGLLEKGMDFWIELYKASPEEMKREYAAEIMQRMIAWEKIVNRFVDRLLAGLDGSDDQAT